MNSSFCKFVLFDVFVGYVLIVDLCILFCDEVNFFDLDVFKFECFVLGTYEAK